MKKRRARPPAADSWDEQRALLTRHDARRAAWRRRLDAYDDATLARLGDLFRYLAAVVAVEVPADAKTIGALGAAHDLFLPRRKAPVRERIQVAVGAIETARAEALRGGEAREHARFTRWQLERMIHPAFRALDIDVMAKGLASKTTLSTLFVRWNKDANHPMGKLTRDQVSRALAGRHQ